MVTGPAGSGSLPYVSGNTGSPGHVGQANLPFAGGSNRVLEVRRATEQIRNLKLKSGAAIAGSNEEKAKAASKMALDANSGLHGAALRKHFGVGERGLGGGSGKTFMPNIGAAIGGTETDHGKKPDLDIHPGGRFGGLSKFRDQSQRPGLWGLDDALKRSGTKPDPADGTTGFGSRGEQHAGLLGEARRSGFVGEPQKHEVSGSAHLKIDVNGPSGTQAKMAKMDGMFKSVKINRGRAAPTASQEA
jgi:hypothetical protein